MKKHKYKENIAQRAMNIIKRNDHTLESWKKLPRRNRMGYYIGWGPRCESWLQDQIPINDSEINHEINRERLNGVIFELETAVSNLDAAVASAKRVLEEVNRWRNQNDE